MPPSVCLNEFKQMEARSWLVSVRVQAAVPLLHNVCLTLTRPRHWVTQHILDSVEVSAEMVSVTGRVTGTQSCCDTRCPLSLTSGHHCHAVTRLTDATLPSDWSTPTPTRPLIGQWPLIDDCHLLSDIWSPGDPRQKPEPGLSSFGGGSVPPAFVTHTSISNFRIKQKTRHSIHLQLLKFSSTLACKIKHGLAVFVCYRSIAR